MEIKLFRDFLSKTIDDARNKLKSISRSFALLINMESDIKGQAIEKIINSNNFDTKMTDLEV